MAQWRKTRLSLAVKAIDDLAPGKPLKGKASVEVAGAHRPPVLHPMGYHLFNDLPPQAKIIHAGGDKYLPHTEEVDRSKLDPKLPVVEFTLVPNSSYPFPEGLTLLKGVVTDKSGNLLAGASVKVRNGDLNTVSDSQGNFAVYVKDPQGSKVTIRLELNLIGFKRRRTSYRNVPAGKTQKVVITLKKK